MSTEVACPNCGKQYKAGGQLAGKRVKCRSCGEAFTIPGVAAGPVAKKDADLPTDLSGIAFEPAVEVEATAFRPNIKLKFPWAATLDRYLPGALIGIGAAWTILQTVLDRPAGNPAWASLLRLPLIFLLYGLVIAPLALLGMRYAARQLRFELPPRPKLRMIAACALPAMFGYVLWLINGGTLALVVGLLAGLLLASPGFWVLFRPRGDEIVPSFGAMAGGFLAGVLATWLVLGLVSWLTNVTMASLQVADTFRASPMGPSFPWDVPKRAEPAKPIPPEPTRVAGPTTADTLESPEDDGFARPKVVATRPTTKPHKLPRPLPVLLGLARDAQQRNDYATLFMLMAERSRLLPGGAGPEIAEDCAIIEKARGLFAGGKYTQAVSVLSDRWLLRHSNTANAYGEVGVELLRECMAGIVMDDAWLRPACCDKAEPAVDSLRKLARDVRMYDPMSVEAVLIEAFLSRPAANEELMRLDLRASVLDRNRLLLPIRTGIQTICPSKGDIHGYNDICRDCHDLFTFHDHLRKSLALSRIPLGPSLVAKYASLVELCTGESRQGVYDDYTHWARLLEDPLIWLHGRGTTYQFISGYMWELSDGKSGIDWTLLAPAPPGPTTSPAADPRLWKRYKATLVRWSHEDANPVFGDLQTRLATMKKLSQPTCPTIGGDQLTFYPMLDVGPAEVVARRVPLAQISLSELVASFTSHSLAKTQQGSSLYFAVDPNSSTDRIFTLPLKAREAVAAGTKGPHPHGPGKMKFEYVTDLRETPLFIALELVGPVQIESATPGPPLPPPVTPSTSLPSRIAPPVSLVDGRGEVFKLRSDNLLETWTAGGGSVLLPVYGVGFGEKALRERNSRILRALKDRGMPDIGKMMELIKGHARGGAESPEELMIGAVLDGTVPIGSKDMSELDFETACNTIRMLVKRIRRDMMRMPQGLAPGTQGDVICSLGDRDPININFIDNKGLLVDGFYKRSTKAEDDQLGQLSERAVTDFISPGFLAMPWPLTPRLCPGSAEINRNDVGLLAGFWLEQARAAAARGDLHSAAAFYRELSFPVFQMTGFDSRQPRDRAAMQELLGQMSTAMERSYQKLQASLEHAAVLRRAGRAEAAGEMSTAIMLEYKIAAMPLLDELHRYTDAYGKAPPPEFEEARSKILALLKSIPATPPAAIARGGAAFDTAAAQGAIEDKVELDRQLDLFYQGKPTLENYCAAKRWLAEQSPQQLHRKPRTQLDREMLLWTPVELVEGSVTALKSDAVFQVGATGRAGRWRDLWYNNEVAGDARAARRLLLDWAGEELNRRNLTNPATPDSVVSDLNRVACLWLAASLDGEMGTGFGACRLDANLLKASRLELEIFIRPRLSAIGLNEADVDRLLSLAHQLIRDAARSQDEDGYAQSRYYWTEYADTLNPLLDLLRPASENAAPRHVGGIVYNGFEKPEATTSE